MTMMLRLLVFLLTLFGSQMIAPGQIDAYSDAANRGPVIIGETMARVEAAAAKYPGAKILNDMPDFKAMGMSAEEVTSSMMQYNRKWVLEQMRSGREIIDIGLDANRKTPSIFYQMEQNMLKNYDILNPGAVKVTTP